MSIVEAFSPRKLTLSRDKLTALGGIASRLHQLTQWKYLAGLWQENLEQELLWHVFPAYPTAGFPLSGPEAPSWSWASIRGKITNRIEIGVERFLPCRTIVSARCLVPGLNPFGAVSGEHLGITGPLAVVHLSHHRFKQQIEFIGQSEVLDHISF